jgi:hypothetical protein
MYKCVSQAKWKWQRRKQCQNVILVLRYTVTYETSENLQILWSGKKIVLIFEWNFI